MSAPPREFIPGEVFHEKYEVVRALARGGMGAVYEVKHVETDRRAALKVMLPSMLASEDLKNRFRAEARVASSIESEHIVEILDAGVDKATGNPFLVMELLRGRELTAAIEAEGSIPVERALVILSQLARTLDKTHAAKVVHRDLKPDNVFLTTREDGTVRVKILDFGIAKIIAEGDQKTRKLGTPLYAAPEQFSSADPISPQTDLYALAHIAFTMLVGTAYFTEELGASSDVHAFLRALQQDKKEAATSRAIHYGKSLPAGFDAWFARATSLRSAGRFVSAGEQHTELEKVLRAAPVSASASSAKMDLGTGAFLALEGSPFSDAASAPAASAAAPSASAEPSFTAAASGTPAASVGAAAPATMLSERGAPSATAPAHTEPPAKITLAKESPPAAAVTSVSATAAPAATATATTAPAPVAAPEPKKGPPTALIAVGGLAVVGLVVGAVVVLGGDKPSPAASADPTSTTSAAPTPTTSSAGPTTSTSTARTKSTSTSKPATDALDQITFTKVDPKVGDKSTSKKTFKSDVTITKPVKLELKTTDYGTTTETILAADGKTILKLKVAFGPTITEKIENGKTTNTKSPVSDKTYIVESKDRELVVTDENYKPVPKAEADLVKASEQQTVGKPLVQLTSLPDGPIKKGATVDAVADLLKSQLVDATTDVSDVKVTLKTIEKDKNTGKKLAIFSVSLRVIQTTPEFKSSAALEGTFTVREDAAPVGLMFTGPVTLSGQVDGAGTMTNTIESE